MKKLKLLIGLVIAASALLGLSSAAAIASPQAIAPTARFQGPCGELRYRAVFNNTHSDRGVSFVFSYRRSVGGMRKITVWVRPGHRFVTQYVRVLAGSSMAIQKLGGEGALAAQDAASAGNYGPCP